MPGTSVGSSLPPILTLRTSYEAGPLGAVKEGAHADLLLMDGKPLENLDLAAGPDESFVAIMKDGVLYKNTIE